MIEITNKNGELLKAVDAEFLRGANLSRAYLKEADLRGANLSEADLSGAKLRGADLSRANLSGANLSRADMSGAYLSRADMSGAYLSGANLNEADLRGANLSEADLSWAYLSGAKLRGADLPETLVVDHLDQKILACISNGSPRLGLGEGQRLDMQAWHACKTTHCRAGWAIVLAGEAGKNLEDKLGPSAAGAIIYACSYPGMAVPNFLASNEEALADIQRRAAM